MVRPYLIALVVGLLGLLITQVFGQYYRSAYLIWACLGVGLRLAMEIRRDHVELTVRERHAQPKSQPSLHPAPAR